MNKRLDARTPWPRVENPGAWLAHYQALMCKALVADTLADTLVAMREVVCACGQRGGKLMFAGNGASASIASHAAVDFTKQAHLRAITFNEANLITCYGNDFGYDRWIEQAVAHHADEGDVLVLISASGRSPNVLRAGQLARERGVELVTFTGMDPANPLRALGTVNFWVDSRSYNIVECTHMYWLMMACDLIIGKAEYEVPRG